MVEIALVEVNENSKAAFCVSAHMRQREVCVGRPGSEEGASAAEATEIPPLSSSLWLANGPPPPRALNVRFPL